MDSEIHTSESIETFLGPFKLQTLSCLIKLRGQRRILFVMRHADNSEHCFSCHLYIVVLQKCFISYYVATKIKNIDDLL